MYPKVFIYYVLREDFKGVCHSDAFLLNIALSIIGRYLDTQAYSSTIIAKVVRQ